MELNSREQQVVDALKELGASNDKGAKQVDDIAKKAALDKNTTANMLTNLTNKKVAKRITKEKSSLYYLLQV